MSETSMTLVDHLRELRKRIIAILLVLLPAAGVSYGFSDQLRALLTRPAGTMKLIYLSPAEALVTDVKLSFLAAAIVTAPVTLYQLWSFISPGLSAGERKRVWPLVVFSVVLFFLGLIFSYTAVLPIALRFMLGFASPTLQATFSYSNYVSFLSGILLSFGLVFQLPLGILFFAHLGWVTPKSLRQKRKYAIFIIFVVAAILTPPDVLSQTLMAAPILVLYELSILMAHFVYRNRDAGAEPWRPKFLSKLKKREKP